ncbi:MAG: response regulator [Sulfurimicrobium sp.]|nr:response regulator [Sulfurimicrobium sp.]
MDKHVQADRQDILVVDDTAANLDLLSSLLKEAGYAVRAAPAPELALRSALARPPALLLLDVRMPGMDGFEVCRRLKQDARTRDVPIIFVSGQDDTQDRVHGFEVGGVDFISKPFQREEILARVRTHLALRQAQNELELRVRERTADLEESLRQLRETELAMDMSGIGVHEVDARTGRILHANDYFCRIHGYALDELQGMTILDLDPTFPKAPYSEIAEPFRQQGRARFETLHLHKDGHAFPVEVTFYYDSHQDDGSGRFVSFMIDISERKQNEEMLSRNEDLTRSVMDSLRNSIAVLDRDGNIIRVNQHWRDFAAANGGGEGTSEGVGENYFDACRRAIATGEAWAESALSGMRAILNGEMPYFHMEYPCYSPAEQRWFMLQASPLTGTLKGLVVNHVDISQLKVAEDKMRLDGEQQATLLQLLETTLGSAPLEETLKACLDQLMKISWLSILPMGGIFLTKKEGQQLRLAVSCNLSPEIRTMCVEVLYGRCLCGRAAASGEIEYASHVDVRHEIAYNGMQDHGHYSLPLITSGQVVGVLVLYLPEGYQREEEKEQFLKSVADILAGYVSRKKGEQSLAGHQANLEAAIHARTTDLKTSEARTRAILATMLDGMVHIDDHGIILNVNDAVQDMFGYTEDEMLGRNVSMLMPEPQASAHGGYIARYLQTRRPHVVGNRIEAMGRRKDSSIFPVELAVNEMVDDVGSTFIGLMRDMTRQKKAEKEVKDALQSAEEAAEAKSSFLANMSHEIRTPLNGILGLAQIGQRDCEDGKIREVFNRLRDSGSHLLAVVNDILDFSKIESGKLKIERRPFALFAILDNVRSFVSELAEAKGLDLSISLAPDLSEWVEGDSLRLAQILTNLLSNAIKFTGHGEVMLRVARDGGEISFMVVDSGIGMSEEQLARLFQPFEQADSSTTRNFGGTGLGLAISINLARLMGGGISVESRLGEGSSFTLQLPLPVAAAPVHPGQPKASPATPGRRLAGLSVLAADDVEINRLILEDLLSHEGAHVVFASDGLQALECLEEAGVSAFDVVLMDVQMPRMDGFETTRHIAAIAPALPVIGLTAHAMAEERDKCFAAGMVDHVVKPVDIDILVAAILRHAHPEIPPARLASTSAPVAAIEDSLFAACDDPGVIDLSILAGRVGNDPAKIAKYALRFIETTHDTLIEMQGALADEDLDALYALGHRLKSAAFTVGAMRFGELCQELEHLKGSDDLLAARAKVEQLSALFTQIDQRVKGAFRS